MKTTVPTLSIPSFIRPSVLLLAGGLVLADLNAAMAAEREGAPRPGIRRDGEGPQRRGPRDGEGAPRPGVRRDGEGPMRRGPRDGEGGVRRGPGDAGVNAERAQPPISIRLNEQGQVLSGKNETVSITVVRSTLKRIAASQKGRPVLVRAPKDTPFGNVVAFVNECEKAGVSNIRFATQ
jgi:hypothetical protein